MSKTLFSIILLLLVNVVYLQAQTECNIPVNDNNKFQYIEVVQMPGISQGELFDRSIKWLTRNFTNAAGRMNQAARENGTVEFDGNIKLFNTDKKGTRYVEAIVKYKLEVQFKDDRYRYNFHKFHVSHGSHAEGIEMWIDDKKYKPGANNERLRQVDEHVKELIASLKNEMKTPYEAPKDEW
jgi:hypothetical protein